MAKNANIIELNGKRYDAASGTLLQQPHHSPHAPSTTPVTPRASAPAAGQFVDGFVPASTKLPNAPIKSNKQITQRAANPARRHQPAKSTTLMRHAVAKPAAGSLKRHHHAQQRTDLLVKQPSITVAPKLSSYKLDQRRVQHAKQTPRSPHVSRYAARQALAARPIKPVAAAGSATLTAAPAISRPASHTGTTSPSIARPQRQPSTDIFEQALARANSHHQPATQPRRAKRRKALPGSRALSIAAASLAVLLLAGFFAWQNRAGLTMRYAAAQAGIDATLPGYKPSGYQPAQFSYSAGKVAVNFKNVHTGNNFALMESSTGWDSQALRDTFVAAKSNTYQTIDAAGRTIYSYGDGHATWVDNGIWYQIVGNGQLNTNQIVDLATSM